MTWSVLHSLNSTLISNPPHQFSMRHFKSWLIFSCITPSKKLGRQHVGWYNLCWGNPYVKRPTPRLTIHTFHSIFHHFLGLVARLQLIWPHQFHSSFLVSTWESSFSSSIKHQMLFLIEKERMNFKVWQEKWKKNEKKRYPQITLAQCFEVWCFGKGLADTEMIFALHIKRQKMNKS